MGHIRLGRLPKTLRWQGVVRLLDEAPEDLDGIMRATLVAARRRLRELDRDPSLAYSFWLLVRVTWAARSPDFAAALGDLGLSVRPGESTIGFISKISDHVRDVAAQNPESGPFAELASLALRRALTETVGQHAPSLFGSSIDDIQAALRPYSTERNFRTVSRGFFADLLARTLRFFVERELPNNVGAGHRLTGLDASTEFASALDLYARQSALIVEQYAADWYGKHNWESRGEVSLGEAQGFVGYAMHKLRTELAWAHA